MLKPQKKRVTKKELKHDPLIDGLLSVQSYFEENKTNIAYGLIGVLAIVAVFYLGTGYMESGKEQAQTLLGKAQTEYNNLNYSKSKVLLEELIADHSGESVEIGTFLLANINFNEKNFSQAKDLYSSFISDYTGNAVLLASGYSGLAACLETENDFNSAADNYIVAANKAKGFPQEPEYLYLAALNFKKAGNHSKAANVLQDIIENHKESAYAYDARAQLILAKAE